MSEIFGAVGAVASSAISANAMKAATAEQIKALERQRRFVYEELDPSKIGGAAKGADIERAQSRLALQAVVDPELLRQRYASQDAISKQLSDLTSGESAADRVAAQATEEALQGPPGMQEAKKALIDAALAELSAGATLPPDLQEEIVRTGLEKSGRVTGGPSGAGFGGRILTDMLGSAGIALKKQRQDQAVGLLGQAQNLEQSRAQILGTLFPNLNTVARGNIAAAQGVLQQSNAMVPEAGLGGSDIANIWLARVGATNQLAQSAADAAARGATAQAQIWNQGMGQAIGYGAKALPTTSQTYNWAKGAFGGGGGSDPAISEGWTESVFSA